jgi:hypothetical protein
LVVVAGLLVAALASQCGDGGPAEDAQADTGGAAEYLRALGKMFSDDVEVLVERER